LPIVSGVLTAGFETILKSIVNKNSGFSSATYLFIIYSIIVILAVPLLITHQTLPLSPLPWIALISVLFVYIAANFSLVSAFKLEDISNITIVTKISFVLTFLFGFIFFQEIVTLGKLFGTLIILLGVIAIFLKTNNFKIVSVKGLLFALLTGVSYSIAGLLSKYALEFFSPYSYIFFIYLGLAISFFFFPRVKEETKKLVLNVKFYFLLLAVIGIFSYLTNLISLKYLDLSFAYILNGASGTVLTVIVGLLLLKERKNILNKLIGTVLVIAGIVLFYR